MYEISENSETNKMLTFPEQIFAYNLDITPASGLHSVRKTPAYIVSG